MAANWTTFADLHAHLKVPLRPAVTDIAITRRAILEYDARVLLLGVTPELSVLGQDLTAIDRSTRMVERVWPGQTGNRRAIVADWLNMPFPDRSFDSVIGDGSLSAIAEALPTLLREIRRVLAPGGAAVFRTFCAPPQAESLTAVKQSVMEGSEANFHALKWRIAMSLAAQAPNQTVPVAAIRDSFTTLFPDRQWLCATTGWKEAEVATIDYYNGADHSICFPTVESLMKLAKKNFASATVTVASGYPLSERCPTVVLS